MHNKISSTLELHVSFLQHCILTHLAQSKVALHKLTLSCHKCRLHDNNLSPKTEQVARIVQS